MTEADIYPLLSSLASGQVYPYVVPLNAQGEPAVSPPWVVYSLNSEVSADTLCGPAEMTATLQIDVYSNSIDEARQLREIVRAALVPLAFTQMNDTNSYETDTSLYRAMLEVQIMT